MTKPENTKIECEGHKFVKGKLSPAHCPLYPEKETKAETTITAAP